eukprot:15466908-Alexandrium_andersonii.AAC.1
MRRPAAQWWRTRTSARRRQPLPRIASHGSRSRAVTARCGQPLPWRAMNAATAARKSGAVGPLVAIGRPPPPPMAPACVPPQ